MRRTWIVFAVILSLLAGATVAQAPTMPPPEPMPDEPRPEQMRGELLRIRESLCSSIEYAALILQDTGTLPAAIPVVVELSGLEPADVEMMERSVCREDPGDLTLEELRANNRQAVWLVEIHLAALSRVLPAE